MTGSRGGDAPRRPTLDMVAQEAGVTRSTVSRAINGEPDVSAATIQVVADAIAKLGYVPNQAARSLVSRRSMAIALIIPESADMFLDDPHLVTLMAGASHRLEESDYILSLIVNGEDPNGKLMRYLSSGAIDGGLIASHHTRNDELMRLRDTFPVVFGGRPTDEAGFGSPWVDVDNRAAAAQATRRLVDLGRRRIGTITGPLDMRAAMERLDGWRDTMGEAGLDDSAVEFGDFRSQGGREAAGRLFERFPDLDGIFVANDIMANAAIAVLLQEGRTVPDDVAVVGFDDSTVAQLGPVRLTTVRQPSLDMGWRMADLLLRMIDGEEVEQVNMMPTELVERDSA